SLAKGPNNKEMIAAAWLWQVICELPRWFKAGAAVCEQPDGVDQDRVRDRQRVIHWDIDMFSAGEQRMYNSYNLGRVGLNRQPSKMETSPWLSRSHTHTDTFCFCLSYVTMNDRGLYSCNLHHLYCNFYETVRVQLNVTKSQQRYWNGHNAVFVVLLGSTAVLPCTNRRSVWTDWSGSLDRQAPGISHDRADRLVDLYASGEQRSYGPLFLQRKMNISNHAFSEGDFSLTISDLQPADQGLYSCHLHHHYCGLHERRVFQVTVEPSLVKPTMPAKSLPSEDKGNSQKHKHTAESPRVITVILPEQRHHFLLPLGYVLTSSCSWHLLSSSSLSSYDDARPKV
uniref:Matrix-remodelling associated 8a n=1 Tax=Maylandia zebra TaxID=106582 RepID=A0A3P9D4H0_9CICH